MNTQKIVAVIICCCVISITVAVSFFRHSLENPVIVPHPDTELMSDLEFMPACFTPSDVQTIQCTNPNLHRVKNAFANTLIVFDKNKKEDIMFYVKLTQDEQIIFDNLVGKWIEVKNNKILDENENVILNVITKKMFN